MRLLDAGLTVTRTAGELLRYHGKMMIVDQRILHLYGFNFTSLDIRRSRSFGVTTRNQALVREALKLFEATRRVRRTHRRRPAGSSSARKLAGAAVGVHQGRNARAV
jgi:hypothetical protein